MTRRRFTGALVAAGAAVLTAAGVGLAGADAPAPTVVVYKSPTCGCCAKWVEHIKAAGYPVRVVDLDDLSEIKATSGVPRALQSCHTAVVEGYVLEGHVPADLVKKLLAERPKVAGLAVPGMPVGSPGMEGGQKEAYNVLAFDRSGGSKVYARR